VPVPNILHLFRVRLRARLAQECFALAGIAIGVALLFASQVASSSLQGSVRQLTRGIAGTATLQLLARAPQGFAQGTLAEVRGIPGVRVAAPLLEASANMRGPRGSAAVDLVGADASLSRLGGELVRHAALAPFGGIGAVVLPAPLARAVGAGRFGQEVAFQLDGRTGELPLYAQLTSRQIGPLTSSPVAIAPLFSVQELTGLPGRVSRILIEPAPGRARQVHAALARLAPADASVEPIDYDETLFTKAATASRQATLLFSVISALVGFLFAFNAMLFTVPQRRSLIAGLRRDGYGRATVVAVLLSDALALALAASALGLLLGEQLSIHVLHSDPAFLSLAFTLGSPQVIDLRTIALALAGGMLATLVAVFGPLLDVLARDPFAMQDPRRGAGARWAGRRRAVAGLACLLGATAILLRAPDAAAPAATLLIGALLLELPIALSLALALAERLARILTSIVPHVVTMELRAAPGRAVAIASTGAIAVFGGVAIQGAHDDLLAGLDAAARELNAASDVWVDPRGSFNLLDTAAFAPTNPARLARLPGVQAVRPYRSGFLDYGDRRVLVIGVPAQATPLLPAGQLVQGDARLASARVRGGGWLVLSRAIAQEHHLRIGQALTLPTAKPTRLRIAALSTNVGWAPGAIVMNAGDYARAWASDAVSAYSVALAPGVDPAAGAEEIRRALGPGSGLAVQTAAQRVRAQSRLSGLALASLAQIATAILIAAALAMAAAMGATIWQRRPRMAKLKLDGLPRSQLWHTVLLECALLVGLGCLLGAGFGLYGQQLADRALASSVGFPVAHSIPLAGLESIAVVLVAAVAMLALPGYLAASVPAALALQD
jgi:putative ABC transport system permease protein